MCQNVCIHVYISIPYVITCTYLEKFKLSSFVNLEFLPIWPVTTETSEYHGFGEPESTLSKVAFTKDTVISGKWI